MRLSNSRVVSKNIIPYSRGWKKYNKENTTFVRNSINNWINHLFQNLLPHEQGIVLMLNINTTVLRDEYKRKIEDLLFHNDFDFFYNKDCFKKDQIDEIDISSLLIENLIQSKKNSVHHIIARSRWWHKTKSCNLKYMDKLKHDWLHRIFDNMLPHEQLFQLMYYINNSALNQHFLNELIKLNNQFHWMRTFYQCLAIK